MRKILLLLTLSAALAASAQTDVQLSQYFEVPSVYNPAAIGVSDLLRIRGGGRMQWVGIDNAPKSFLGVADMPVKLGGKRIGVGAVMQTESYGLYSSLQVGLQGAYKLKKLGGTWSLGFRLGLMDQGFKGSEVYIPEDDDYHQSTDDAIPTRDIHGTAFDMDFGLTYTHRLFWAGISCTHLLSPTIKMQADNAESTTADQEYTFRADRTLYFMGGCNIPIKNTLFEVMPSVLVKSDFTFTTGEATLRARYRKMFTVGVGYRYNDAVYLTLAAEIKNFFIGYAYDYSTSAIAKASSGSHEFLLGYSLKLDLSDKNKHKHKNIRIM